MEKNTFFIQSSLCTIGIIILFGLSACKKSAGHTASDNTFSFRYNGIHYSIAPLTGEYNVDSTTIGITDFDIFSAPVYFKIPDCAYYFSDNPDVSVSSDCQLTNHSSMPIDSAAVYIYQSGSLNVAYSNCNTESFNDLSGNPVTAQYCDMEGSFDLVLKNKENKLITISDGQFVQYNTLRYWKYR